MSAKTKYTGSEIVLAIIMVVALFPFSAWVRWKLWGWFAVPVGLPLLTFGQVWGLSILITAFTMDANASQESEDMWEQVRGAFGLTLAILFIGYILHLIIS